MIQTSLFRDTFLYFAKFPLMDGVLKLFNLDSSALFEQEYNDLRGEITAAEEHSLIPGIENYIFGVDEDLVKKRIKEISGFYLFVDYGALSAERDQFRTKSESILIAITVAVPIKPETYDHIEALLLAERAMDYISQIRGKMEEDSRNSPFVQHLTFPNEITPFFARELHNSTGFTMVFSKQGVGLI